ncbi:MAG TPA: DUF2752 domain-containing protein [Candidatus Dormibacteraeota bacterium]|nr:DUF2752 domain-containing protein [Candidatus Dormibacteraeota bacterium]
MSTPPIAFTPALPSDRRRDLLMIGGLVLWLTYTRVFWALHAAHISAPPCPFYYLTGHPCPFCGGTRSFAYMWLGNLSDSVRLYPLGPLLFAGTFTAIAGLGFGAVTGRTWVPQLSRMQWRLLWIGVSSAILFNWALKVFVLGN